MTIAGFEDGETDSSYKGHFSELLRIQGRLALREPYGIVGIVFPVVLLILIGFIGKLNPGNVANTGLTVIDLYIPTIIVIGLITISIYFPNSLVRDREIGWLRRISTTPVHPSRLLAAQVILNLVFALIMVFIVIYGGEIIFNAPLEVNVPFFAFSIVLSIAVIFSIGLVVAALAPTQTSASALGGVVFFTLLFFSGLWIQPASVSGVLQTIMYYSPAGAAVRALLYSSFNEAPPLGSLLALLLYASLFIVIAARYFRWE